MRDGAARARPRQRRGRSRDLGGAAAARRAVRARRRSTGPGFPPNPPVDRVDFEPDAELVAELLQPGDHLVGHSYGGVISLLAAAPRSERVRSLTVIEPPATTVAAGQPRGRRVRRRRSGALRVGRERRPRGVPAEVPARGRLGASTRPHRSRRISRRARRRSWSSAVRGRRRSRSTRSPRRRSRSSSSPGATTRPSTRSATCSSERASQRSASCSRASATPSSATRTSTRRSPTSSSERSAS